MLKDQMIIHTGGIYAKDLYNIDQILDPESGFTSCFIDSTKHVIKDMYPTIFKDSTYAGVVLQQNLQAINPYIFTRRHPENTFLNIPNLVADSTGGAADIITSLRIAETGDFVDNTTVGDNDGNIDIFGESSTIKVYERTAYGSWTKGQLEKAALQRIDIPTRIVEAASKRYLRNLNDLCYIGNVGTGTFGALNYPGYVTNNITWTGVTNAEKYQIISTLITDQWSSVANTPEYMATEVHMPTSIYNEIAKELVDPVLGETILYRLEKNFPGVRFIPTYKAENVSGKKVIVAFNPGMDCMAVRIPTPLETGEIIKDGSSFRWRMDFRYRTAGVDFLEDSAGRIIRLS